MQNSRPTLSPRQEQLVLTVDRGIYHVARHWVWLLNTVGFTFAALPILAPVLASRGFQTPANVIYSVFSLMCHQEPERSFFLFGHQLAYCQRDFAIYTGLLALGLIFPLVRSRVRPMSLWPAILLSIPMALDGFSQLLGLRESTWELRLLTGGLFALAVAGLIFPRLEIGFGEIQTTLVRRFDRLALEGRAKRLR